MRLTSITREEEEEVEEQEEAEEAEEKTTEWENRTSGTEVLSCCVGLCKSAVIAANDHRSKGCCCCC